MASQNHQFNPKGWMFTEDNNPSQYPTISQWKYVENQYPWSKV